MTLLSAMTVLPYLVHFMNTHLLTKGNESKACSQPNNPFLCSDKAFVYVVYHLGLFVISLLFMHVQVMTRCLNSLR